MFLLIDNYDSFTYNLVHYMQELSADVQVYRHDAITLDEIAALNPTGIVISPGPGTPNDAGICLELVKQYGATIPMFGVCLGHQTMAQAFGGKIIRAKELMHGKTSPIHHEGKSVFAGLPSPFTATRYHSLVAEPESLPDCFDVTATVEDGTIMGIMHKTYPLHGVQFHPESIASEHGHAMLKTFMDIAMARQQN